MKVNRLNKTGGFDLIDALVVIGVFALLTAVFLPHYAQSKHRGKRVNCVNNLKCIGLSFRMWALDNNDLYPMRVSVATNGVMELAEQGQVFPIFQVMSNELNTPKILRCLADSSRTNAISFAPNFSEANISYFVGLDANDAQPQGVLAGDDNLLINGQPRSRGVVSLWSNTPVTWSAQRHVNQGNLALADGSVQQLSNVRLAATLNVTGSTSNRLVFP